MNIWICNTTLRLKDFKKHYQVPDEIELIIGEPNTKSISQNLTGENGIYITDKSVDPIWIYIGDIMIPSDEETPDFNSYLAKLGLSDDLLIDIRAGGDVHVIFWDKEYVFDDNEEKNPFGYLIPILIFITGSILGYWIYVKYIA